MLTSTMGSNMKPTLKSTRRFRATTALCIVSTVAVVTAAYASDFGRSSWDKRSHSSKNNNNQESNNGNGNNNNNGGVAVTTSAFSGVPLGSGVSAANAPTVNLGSGASQQIAAVGTTLTCTTPSCS